MAFPPISSAAGQAHPEDGDARRSTRWQKSSKLQGDRAGCGQRGKSGVHQRAVPRPTVETIPMHMPYGGDFSAHGGATMVRGRSVYPSCPCRYCGARTIFGPVLSLLTLGFPHLLPCQSNWMWTATHPLYWERATSCDHVFPWARGDTSQLDGQLQKVLAVVKMRGSQHSKDLRRYMVTDGGLEVGEALTGFGGIITGVARRQADRSPWRPAETGRAGDRT